MSKDQQYFYCIKPEKMVGAKLVPLSKLKDISSSDYLKNKSKYKNRKEIGKQEVKVLNCTWEDVIFFSTLNPFVIFTSLELLGLFDKQEISILKFPIDSLKDKEFCLYLEDKKEVFKKININSYKEEKFLPYETAKYFVECIKSEEDPLIFSGVPHLLLKDSLDVKLAEEISYIPLFDY